MIENTRNRTWGVTEEQRRADVVDAILAAQKHGVKLTARNLPGVYSQARKAFGSWSAALEAAGQPVKPNASNAHANRDMDAVSPYLVPGFPDFMRERQLIGGRMIEMITQIVTTEQRDLDPRYITDDLIRNAFMAALLEWQKTQ